MRRNYLNCPVQPTVANLGIKRIYWKIVAAILQRIIALDQLNSAQTQQRSAKSTTPLMPDAPLKK
jgi:hypothetical protein